MTITRRLLHALGGAALIAGLAAAPAGAETTIDTYPETPEINPDLPIVHTEHGSSSIKANVLNPRPVCNPWEDHRTVITKVADNFSPVGTISTTNRTDRPIPLTQETSKSQEIAVKINGSQTEQTDVNLGGSGENSQDGSTAGGQWGIAYSLTRMIGGEASYSLSWSVGQTIGPYDVPAGYTGEATYGFRTVTMTGTQQYCKLDGTWSNPTAYTAFVPIKNEVRVKLYDNPADSAKN
ncbi:hypothetical protein JSY14_09800 [Brachybacterium sp. EF45031]|uniref:hypothetical protein n=1 Tax=Brachybacterium sillae TaxID=2810536 RepID=UPI00217F1252|nr:hypothetical protein [Brachybacterium sillae]MCS6712296.1 hypothetical protein [Brachybacterium sillae]